MMGSFLTIVAVLLLTKGNVDSFVARPQVFAPFLQTREVTHHPSEDLAVPSSGVLRMSGGETEEAVEAVTIDGVIEELETVKKEFDEEASQASTEKEFEQLRRKYLSKKGPVNQAMRYMRTLPPEDKPKLGVVVNSIKDELEELIKARKEVLFKEEVEQQIEEMEQIDVTMPGIGVQVGHRHPLLMTIRKAVDIFVGLGYDAITSARESPEIESDYYCFEALNCPADHPARDMQDTFYLTNDQQVMLRTHTSSVQIRQLEKRGPPIRIVAPGRVYRRDDVDATHSWMFHQVEILAVEKKGELTLGHLKGTVDYFLKNMLGERVKTRYRGSYFPFTCPSMEVDVLFRGKWLEVLGCGMVDPNVLEMAGVDPDEYGGFAAGFGVERFTMVIHEINDIREFYKNDLRFLEQFPRYTYHGWDNFLKGHMAEPPVDIRREEPPEEFVTTMEELEEYYARLDGVELVKPAPKYCISKLDLRVGIIEDVWQHEGAPAMFCMDVNIGEAKPRLIVVYYDSYYTMEELKDKKVVVLVNVKEEAFAGCPSHGKIMCAAAFSGEFKELIQPPEDATVGERVMVEGYEGEPAHPIELSKLDMMKYISTELVTNDDGVATFMDKPLSTKSGVCKAEKGLANANIEQ